MLIQIPDNFPVFYLMAMAADAGCQIKWKPDNEIEAELFPVTQPQPAEASSEVGV